MKEFDQHLRTDQLPFEQLHREVELGWKDVDAGRVTDFDAEDIKNRGRERRAPDDRLASRCE